MDECSVKSVEVIFRHDRQVSSRLRAERCDNGWYSVTGLHERSSGYGFPAHETVSRTGMVYADDMQRLMRKLYVSCRQGWYHHYRPYGIERNLQSTDSAWSLRIETPKGLERWEGCNCAPSTLSSLYADLLAFGMPPLRPSLESRDTLMALYQRAQTHKHDPWPITSYMATLDLFFADDDADGTHTGVRQRATTKLRKPSPADMGEMEDQALSLSDERALLTREFVEDTLLYLERCFPKALDKASFSQAWKVDETPGALADLEVSGVDRTKLMLLFGALARCAASEQDLGALVRAGVLDRWRKRLGELPAEERAERIRQERERRSSLTERLDASIRNHAGTNKPFTSYDVARECGTSAQQANARIRTFVKRGELTPLEGPLPRRYQAA